jgi:hypothetical protein
MVVELSFDLLQESRECVTRRSMMDRDERLCRALDVFEATHGRWWTPTWPPGRPGRDAIERLYAAAGCSTAETPWRSRSSAPAGGARSAVEVEELGTGTGTGRRRPTFLFLVPTNGLWSVLNKIIFYSQHRVPSRAAGVGNC